MIHLIRYELKKIFLHRSIWIVLLLFTLLNVWKIYDVWRSESYFSDSPEWKAAYWKLYPEYEGQITQEKIDNLNAIYQPLFDKVKDWTFNRAINPDTITGINEFSDYLFLGRYFMDPLTNFSEYSDYAENVCSIAAENVRLYYSLDNKKEVNKNTQIYLLFKNRKIDEFAYTERDERLSMYSFSDYLILSLCCYIYILAIDRERESEMGRFIHTTLRGGQSTTLAKLIVVIVISAIISLYFFVLNQLAFRHMFGWSKAGHLPLYALTSYKYTPLAITISEFYLLTAILKILSLLTLLIVFYNIARFVKSPLSLSVVGIGGGNGLILLSEQLSNGSSPWIKVLNPCSLLTYYSLFSKSEFVCLFGRNFLTYKVAILFQAIITIALLILYLFFAKISKTRLPLNRSEKITRE